MYEVFFTYTIFYVILNLLKKGEKQLMKKKIFTKDNLIFFLILNLGLIFTAIGISIFKTPNHFAFGGTSGLSIILSTLFPKWNVGAFM